MPLICKTYVTLPVALSSLTLGFLFSKMELKIKSAKLEMKKERLQQTMQKYKGSLATAAATAAKSLQSCPTLCDPIDGSPPGSPVSGTLQARTLEWVAISFSKA